MRNLTAKGGRVRRNFSEGGRPRVCGTKEDVSAEVPRLRDVGGLRVDVAVIENAVLIIGAALHHGLDLGLAHHISANDHAAILHFL